MGPIKRLGVRPNQLAGREKASSTRYGSDLANNGLEYSSSVSLIHVIKSLFVLDIFIASSSFEEGRLVGKRHIHYKYYSMFLQFGVATLLGEQGNVEYKYKSCTESTKEKKFGSKRK